MASSAGNALSLIKAVLDLVADRRTGVLDVTSDGVRTRIYFDDGKPVFAEDEALGESFGRLLMRQGVITNDRFVQVIDEMTRAAQGNSQLRFGEVAVGLGVLTPEQVERGLAEQVCGIITRSLQRAESQWTFEPSPAAADPPRAFSLQINPAVLTALGESTDRSMVAGVVAARPEELVVVAGSRPASDVRDEAGGAAVETHAARMAAEQAFQKGVALLRETKTASAAIELRRAADLQPESLEYQLYATWATARRFRDIPVESDQQALLEIAHKAKRRDPMFAFASYVIGQLAMWAGDEATAKKWFYEALRLDPTSEAGQQVRILARRGGILARRGGETAAPSGGDARPAHDEHPEPAPLRVSAPPARQAAPALQTPRPPSSPWAKRLGAGAALLVTAAIVSLAVARKAGPRAGLAASASPQPALAIEPAPAVAQEQNEQKEQKEHKDAPATKPVEATDAKDDDDPDMGTVVLPARASGHRIFVDGRRAKMEGIEPLHLRCGPHVIQIGSSGTPESIDLPCRGEVQLQ